MSGPRVAVSACNGCYGLQVTCGVKEIAGDVANLLFVTENSESATFLLGGERKVHRLGLGTMRFTGRRTWGPPEEPDECRAVLRRAVELGVDFIDTADSYGLYVAEELIGQTLAGHDDVTIATKAGLTRLQPLHPRLRRPPQLADQLRSRAVRRT